MKKIVLNIIFAVLPLTIMAQLPYDTELTEELFSNANVTISKTDKCEWSLKHIAFGTSVLNFVIKEENHCVIALPKEGLPKKLYFEYRSVGTGTLTFSQSTDHENWTGAWTKEISTKISSAYADSVELRSDTRFLKFYFNGYAVAYLSAISVSEKKELSVSTTEIQFPAAMVEDAPASKSVTVNWTNVVTSVSSSNPVFTISTPVIGEKNKENQSTNLTISYSHNVYGTHEGVITIEGEGLKKTINVSGSTSRYEQTLTWNQNLGEHYTTDHVQLNAYTDFYLPISYFSSDSSIAWVDSLGNVQVVCAGEVSITAQQLGNYKYAPTAGITKPIKFIKAKPVIAVTAEPITYGQALKEVVLTKTAGSVTGTWAFVDINPDSIFEAGTYDLMVRFTPDNQCIYDMADRLVAIVVNKATQTITWEQEQTSLLVGETIELSAKASSGLDLTYAFTDCNISIEGNQMVGVEEGDVLVIAFQSGNKNYLPTTVVMQAFYVEENPTAIRRVEENLTLDELEKGKKYLHNGLVYFYYRGKIYNAEGQLLKQ